MRTVPAPATMAEARTRVEPRTRMETWSPPAAAPRIADPAHLLGGGQRLHARQSVRHCRRLMRKKRRRSPDGSTDDGIAKLHSQRLLVISTTCRTQSALARDIRGTTCRVRATVQILGVCGASGRNHCKVVGIEGSASARRSRRLFAIAKGRVARSLKPCARG